MSDLIASEKRPDIQSVTRRYADWSRTPDGILMNSQIVGSAILLMSKHRSKQDYDRDIRALAAGSGIPPADFLLLAEYQLEMMQCLLAGIEPAPLGAGADGAGA